MWVLVMGEDCGLAAWSVRLSRIGVSLFIPIGSEGVGDLSATIAASVASDRIERAGGAVAIAYKSVRRPKPGAMKAVVSRSPAVCRPVCQPAAPLAVAPP